MWGVLQIELLFTLGDLNIKLLLCQMYYYIFFKKYISEEC